MVSEFSTFIIHIWVKTSFNRFKLSLFLLLFSLRRNMEIFSSHLISHISPLNKFTLILLYVFERRHFRVRRLSQVFFSIDTHFSRISPKFFIAYSNSKIILATRSDLIDNIAFFLYPSNERSHREIIGYSTAGH